MIKGKIFEGTLLDRVNSWIAVMLSIYAIYYAAIGSLTPILHRAGYLGFSLVVLFLSIGDRDDEDEQALSVIQKNIIKPKKHVWLNVILAFLSSLPVIYLFVAFDYVAYRIQWVTPLRPEEVFFGISLVVLIIVGSWIKLGKAIAILTIVFVVYSIFGKYLPGMFKHPGYTMSVLVDQLYLNLEGIFGNAIGVAARYVVIFVIMGSFLKRSGITSWIIDIAYSISKYLSSGPAQMSVISSALFGTISGTAVANVVATGQITIPFMKKMGYKPAFAGAVEATASMGGQIMPPILASVGFLIAEFTGTPYVVVIKHAFLPAMCYYLSLAMMVHITHSKDMSEIKKSNKKSNIELNKNTVSRDVMEFSTDKSLIKVFFERCYLLIPILILIGMLFLRYTPTYAAFFALLSIVIISWVTKENSMGIVEILQALSEGAKNSITVAIACAAAGIIMGVLSITGMDTRLAIIVVGLSKGNLFLALVFAAAATIIAGMGLPTAAAYLVCVSMIIPSLIRMGALPIAAHMFIFYYSVVSTITPPVAISSYAAASLAKANFWETSWHAIKLALPAFILPFYFMYYPSILFIGDNIGIIVFQFIAILLALLSIEFALKGWIFTEIAIINRVLLFILPITLVSYPGFLTSLLGVIVAIILIILNKIKLNKTKNSVNLKNSP